MFFFFFGGGAFSVSELSEMSFQLPATSPPKKANEHVHPGRLTWNLKFDGVESMMIFPLPSRGHV